MTNIKYLDLWFVKTSMARNYLFIAIFPNIRESLLQKCFDSKKWIYDCGIHSSPFGSVLIARKNKNRCFKCMKPKPIIHSTCNHDSAILSLIFLCYLMS